MVVNLPINEREPEADLEIGETTSEEERTDDFSVYNQNRRVPGMVPDEPWPSLKFGEVAGEHMKLLLDKDLEGKQDKKLEESVDELRVQSKQKKKKAGKPPRPPKGPSLDEADKKLIQEITDIAKRRRLKMEQIKELKKMRAKKSPLWNGSLFAVIIIAIFSFLIVFQGIWSRHRGSISFQGSPAPSVATANEGLITIQFSKNFSDYEGNAPGYDNPTIPSLQEFKEVVEVNGSFVLNKLQLFKGGSPLVVNRPDDPAEVGRALTNTCRSVSGVLVDAYIGDHLSEQLFLRFQSRGTSSAKELLEKLQLFHIIASLSLAS